jgi:hypothetical protein
MGLDAAQTDRRDRGVVRTRIVGRALGHALTRGRAAIQTGEAQIEADFIDEFQVAEQVT